MTEKKSIKASLSGVAASSVSLLGACCATGACAASCGVVCLSPIASFLGISTAGLSTWSSNFLPVFTAISAVAFTIAYYSLYKQKNDACCDNEAISSGNNPKNRWTKPVFWIGLLLTFGFYTKAAISNTTSNVDDTACCASTSSCTTEKASKGCAPSSCSTFIIEEDEGY